VQATGRCRVALSGGSTPAATYEGLARALDGPIAAGLWITVVDERQPTGTQAPNHAASNLRLAQRHLLAHLKQPPQRLLPMGSPGTPDQQLAAFSAGLKAFGGLDVAILGAGPDGHIGSLFPDRTLDAVTLEPLLVTDSPKPPPLRMTLSLASIQATDHLILLARGAEKAAMLARAQRGDVALPVGRLSTHSHFDWVIDPAAACDLERETR
jgi:6-phosphogluconolactonase